MTTIATQTMPETATAADIPMRVSPWLAASSLAGREVVRFLRQPNRVIGALGQPLLFWLLFGAGLQRSFRMDGDATAASGPTFLEYYYPGTVILILLFTAIFATISIIEDRREGFLQAVLVAPIPRWSMVLGKVLGGAVIATAQGVLFLLLALVLSVNVSLLGLLMAAVLLMVTAVGLTSLGFVIAWRMESTQGFHAIMNLALMPMWLLSGAFFPVPALTAGGDWGQWLMHWLMRLNPLTYCVAGLRQILFEPTFSADFWSPKSTLLCCLITFTFSILIFAVAVRISRQRISADIL